MARDLLASGHPWLDGITYERLVRDGWARLAVPAGWSAMTERQVPLAFRPVSDAPANVADVPGGTGNDARGTPRDRAASVRQLGPLRLGALRYQSAAESPSGDTALAKRYPLALMSLKQHQRFLNSHYGGFEHHLPDPPQPQLEIGAADAAARGIADGERVRVFNHRGALFVTAAVSDRLQPGLVAMPFGWWAGSADGRTVNVLTNAAVGGHDSDVGSAAFHDTLVEVEPAPGTRQTADGPSS